MNRTLVTSARLLVASFACLLCVAGTPASAFAATAAQRDSTELIGNTTALQLDHASSLDGIITDLATCRVIYVGEIHTRYDHHLVQLHIIRRLVARGVPLAIGVEWFQQPFQPVLDRYIAGEISEQSLLKQTQYFSRWSYDFRLYAPILRYARANRIPVIALNVPTELTHTAGETGLHNLPLPLRRWVPDRLDRSNTRYKTRLRKIYAAHPRSEFSDFERFYTVQLLWDEGMAQRAAQYLQAHARKHMVILAGSGHLAYGDGIPARVKRRIDASSAIVLNQWHDDISADMADYLLLTQELQLPPAGVLGVTIETAGSGVRLREVSAGSAAAQAGVRAGDELLAIDGEPIAQLADVRTAMWQKLPGDRISVTVRRADHQNGADRPPKTLDVVLQ